MLDDPGVGAGERGAEGGDLGVEPDPVGRIVVGVEVGEAAIPS
ncbi:MAG TPA: hypothetical protein VH268_12515 [Solirubrobacterales bacterium]|nr:hypothetical protein [Solirubrobacterales bacterium]